VRNAYQPMIGRTASGLTTQDGFVARFDTDLIGDASLLYSTYLGGDGAEQALAIAVDPTGNAYVGSSIYNTTNFPTTWSLGSGEGGYLTKLLPLGSGIGYSTRIAGATPYGVAVSATGEVFSTGVAGATFPVTPNAFQPTVAFYYNPYVLKLNSLGTALLYSTFLGGSGSDFGLDVALDAAGRIHVTGQTTSTDFPVLFDPAVDWGDDTCGSYDVFVAKLDPGQAVPADTLVYSTYLGGSVDEVPYVLEGNGIALDANGNAYVTGTTYSADFPIEDAYQAFYADNGDAFPRKR